MPDPAVEKRDRAVAVAALDVALKGQKPGIGLNDSFHVERMLLLIEEYSKDRGVEYRVERTKDGIYIHFVHLAEGRVYLFAADRLLGTDKEKN